MLKRWLLALGFLIICFWTGIMVFAFSRVNAASVSADAGRIIALAILALFVVGVMASFFGACLGLLHMFDKIYAVSDEQKRYLTFAAVLFKMNGESCRMFKLRMATKGNVKNLLRYSWDIKGHAEALEVAQYLSAAEGHTLFADDVYKNLIQKGRLESLKQEDLQVLKEENACQADRISNGIKCYKSAKKMLVKLGYTESELSEIGSLSAWDFGRVGFIARYSTYVGYLREDEAWRYMKTAAENATGIYSGWREYLAAYILGRAVGYSDNSSDLRSHLKYLLNNGKSPFNEISFK